MRIRARSLVGAGALLLAGFGCKTTPREPVVAMDAGTPSTAQTDAGVRPQVATPTPTATTPADASVGPTGTIEGIVRLNGPLPPARPIAIEPVWAQRQGCTEAARGWFANVFPITAPGPLPYAVVTADAHSPVPPPRRNRTAVWNDCTISPPVLVMSLNDRLILHANTNQHHLVKVDGQGSTIAQMLNREEDQEKPITRPGRYILHSVNYPNWMQSPLLVTPNWFYDQTNEAGRFRITGVPVGEVVVHAWYPNARETQATVTVRANETVTQDFVLNPIPTNEIVPLQPAQTPDAGPVIP